jgi:hypothetical protein
LGIVVVQPISIGIFHPGVSGVPLYVLARSTAVAIVTTEVLTIGAYSLDERRELEDPREKENQKDGSGRIHLGLLPETLIHMCCFFIRNQARLLPREADDRRNSSARPPW